MPEEQELDIAKEIEKQNIQQEQREQTGCIHVYCGDGKGKTTCAMGLCMRAAGYGYRVLIYQFMKGNGTNERKVLETLPNVTFIDGRTAEKFSFTMAATEREHAKKYYQSQFQKVICAAKEYDVLYLDEILYAIRSDLFPEQELLSYLGDKPEHLEVILTGQGLSEELYEVADYVTEMCKLKHPYDRGVAAREGIEK